jgi:phosphate:Na+ symporter
MEALFMELGRIGEISRRICSRALTEKKHEPLEKEGDRRALESLVDAVGDFTGRMRQNRMPEELSNRVPNALRVSRYYSEAAELAESVAAARAQGDRIEHQELIEDIKAFETRVDHLLNVADSRSEDYSLGESGLQLSQILTDYQALKSRLLKAGADGLIQVRPMVDELDTLSNVRRIGEQIEKGARYLFELTRRRDEEDDHESA